VDTVDGVSPVQKQADGNDSQRKQWESEFPYHWDADELVSRRDLLQFAVYTSGTLFLATALLAILGRLHTSRVYPEKEIASIDQVPIGEALYFEYPGPRDQAVLLHLQDGSFAAYSQVCTHLSCSVYYERDKDRLFCPCHEGIFDSVSGQPIAGPPVRPLPRIKLQSNGVSLYAIGVEP
jgi:nitrite reductase/ring-hydroxylating ferredoxin subunit